MNYFKSSITSIVLLLIFLMPTTSHAAIDSLWSKVYDYCEEMHTYGSMAKTNDGNFLMLPSCGPNLEGNNYTHDYSGAIIKINSEGDTLWTNYVNLWDGYDTFWRGFIEFDNGEFLFTSHIQYPNGYKYPVLIRTDSIGDTLWTKHFYSDSTNNMYMSDPIHNNENNYCYSGGTTLGSNELNAWIVEIDATNGDSLMQSYYGDSTSQYFSRLYKLEDGSFIAAGNQTDSNDNRDFWLVKLDELLNVVWEKSYGGDGYDSMAELIINNNGDYTMVGRTESFGEGGQDGYVVRTDSDGTVLWDTTFGGVDTDRFYDVIETVDNNLLLAGWSNSYGDRAYWVVKINESGALIDERLFDSQYNDKGTGIIATSYDEFIIYGLRYHGGYEEPTDTWLVKFSTDVTTENNAPAVFTLSMPLVNTAVQNLSPVFNWHPANDPDPIDTVHYTLMLDTPDPGVAVFEVGTDTSFQVPDPLMDNTQYYWQVIAEDLLGFQTVNAGGYQTFYINLSNDPPTASTLVAPLNESIQTDLTPNFYWTEADDPDPLDHVSYTLSWWGTGNMGIQTLDTDSNSVTPGENLMDNSMWQWTVNTMDMSGADALSDTVHFYTDAFPEPPSNFATITPANNAEGIATQVEFAWNETDDPDPVEEIQYQLVYATDWADSSTYVFSRLFEDTSLTVTLDDNSQYYWIVMAMDTDGFVVVSNENRPNTMVVGTLSIDGADIPEVFALHQNYPNPFNPTTQIRYDLPEDVMVSITIYDLMGRSIKSLVNSNQSAGYRSIRWNATNILGEPVSAGMYIYMIQAGQFRQTKKMVLLK